MKWLSYLAFNQSFRVRIPVLLPVLLACGEDGLTHLTLTQAFLGSNPSTSASFTEGYATGDVASALNTERARDSQGFDSAIPPPEKNA